MTRLLNLFALIAVIACTSGCTVTPEQGVTQELARERKQCYSNVEYSLFVSIPRDRAKHIAGRVEIGFDLLERRDVIIDFREHDSCLHGVMVNNRVSRYRFENGHIMIPASRVSRGFNLIEIDFTMGETSLNRKNDFLYTLFVPDRASTAFPCFDQPDLKATFKLTLEVPNDWVAISNGQGHTTMANDSTRILLFDDTKPISTYLFAFVAGKFKAIARTESGRTINMYHRENDSIKVRRNLDAIFTGHFHSLEWLREYTGIEYPFGKLDIILIPDFQYSGMEHPGAIYYRDTRLLLDENPTVNQKLRQANLIAHEVSHQWFGNLVTMRWFNDVWLKEVFAGFMADKIVNPQYPDINHNLNFLLSHYPSAYSVDRSEGANPIRQNLDNLLNAGSMYGDIIYHKAPVMMLQLEKLMGEEPFRAGVQLYLKEYGMANADWEELVAILDPLTDENLSSWSHAWVDIPGMPTISTQLSASHEGLITGYMLHQAKPHVQNAPAMGMVYSIGYVNNGMEHLPVRMTDPMASITGLVGRPMGGCIIPNSDGLGYGCFVPDSISLNRLVSRKVTIADENARASAMLMLNELFLNGAIEGNNYYHFLLQSLPNEKEPQIRQYLLENIETLWWRFFNSNDRANRTGELEQCLWELLNSKEIMVDERKPLFWAFARTHCSTRGSEFVYRVWANQQAIGGIKLDEQDYITLAYELAVREYRNGDSILDKQQERITNPDRLAKFKFVRNAVASDVKTRDLFFVNLADYRNRRPEPWVTNGLHYLHHPLRASTSINYVKSSLDLLPEIQRTGDIFFPKAWLDATLWGYSSPEVYRIVTNWLAVNSKLNSSLRAKVLQSSDILRRSSSR